MSEELNINKVSAEVITDLAKSAAETVVSRLTKAYTDIINKNNIDYGLAFEKYLLESERHISRATTILYGQTPHYL